MNHLLKEMKYYKTVDGNLRRVFFKFLFSRTPLKLLVNTSLYKKIYTNMMLKKAKQLNPYILSLENTNICNADCIMCPHSKMKRKQETMKEEDFKTIVNKVLTNENIEYVMFTGLGETLCDINFEKKVEYLNNNFKTKVIMFSNAGLLTKERSDNLLKLNIFKINFSVNGPANDYNKNMGLNYNNSLNNINYFLKRKNELGLKFPLVNISIMKLDKDIKKYKKFKKEWTDKVDSAIIFMPSDWTNDIKLCNAKSKRWPCHNLWKEIAVDAAGNVIKCHGDYESVHKLGNLITEDYSTIKKAREEIKIKQLTGDFSICKNCESSFYPSLDWWENR